MDKAGERPAFPFSALVGQEEMKRCLLWNLVHPGIGGLLLLGQRGTAKSTAVRSLAALMPEQLVVAGCPCGCEPDDPCETCRGSGRELESRTRRMPVVDLPLGASEDRVVGTLDLEAALLTGHKRFEPGLLAKANRGFLYIDEVNLLEDHLVDLLLDVAASGVNVVEREAVSLRHPARFVLVGSGNPEEGELRPQLLDRFGLCASIITETDPDRRVEIMRRRLEYERDPEGFSRSYADDTCALKDRILRARKLLARVTVSRELLQAVAALNAALEVPGHRGEIALASAARAAAALDGRTQVRAADLKAAALPALRHRLRTDPLESRDLSGRILQAAGELLPGDPTGNPAPSRAGPG